MGGIVAAETVLAITSEQPLTSSADPEMQSFMFPYIQGILAFDTPYLGIAPGVVAHGAEGHLNTASAAITQLSGLAGGMWGGSAAAAADSQTRAQKEKSHAEPKLVEPPPTTAAVGANDDAAATPTWQRWGKIAMFAGAAGAVAAGGAAAYLKRDQITEGWSWVGSHLEFVGCLVKGEEMQQRLQQVVALQTTQDMGFADLYTVLGAGASSRGVVGNSGLLEKDRTFCNLPKSALKSAFIPLINDAAKDEAGAHMYMFSPKHNPGYYHMSEQAKALIVQWAEKIIPRESPVRDAGAPLLYDNNAEDPEEKPPGVARSGNISRDGQDGLTSPVVAAGVVDEAAIWSS
ncbi:MAG: hypothetical protein M1838_003529 [Thelocarpon superellum]|nr:MAG: hypothetical protein M1838_003529 [Thelocarpon superellum]